MDQPIYTYKSNQRFSKIPSCTFDIKYFKKLFEIISDINREAAEIEVNVLNKRYEQSTYGVSKEDFEKLKKDVLESYKIHIQIFGTKGEFITSYSSSIFEEEHVPDFITSIKFDNSFFYKSVFNRNPQSLINVELDFSKPPLIDFVTSPSYPTLNNSIIHVLGEKETWVEGSHEKVISSLEERNNRRSWLHRKNVYDLFLWLLVLPVSLWNIRRFDLFASPYLSKFSTVLSVGVYLYIFIIIVNVFRFAFNYLRWLFPYLELKTSLKSRAVRHRVIFFGVISVIAYTLTKDIFVCVIKYLF